MVQICEVTTKRQLKAFIKFPNVLYKGNPYYVPALFFDEKATLEKKKNPSFEYCTAKYWLAYKDGKIVGRIAGIINYKFIEKWNKKYARFGWIDFIDDPEVSKALIETVENWAKKNGMEGVHGPLGFCDLDKEGLLVEGYEEMGSIITMYHYPYYKEHLEKLGYAKDIDWLEFDVVIPSDKPSEELTAMAQKALSKYDLNLVELKKTKDALKYVNEMFDLINIAYKDLYGVVELTDKQKEAYTTQYFSFVNIDYLSFLLDKEGKLAAFAIVLPSLSEAVKKSNGKLLPFGFLRVLKSIRKNKILDLYLVAVRPEYKNTGVASICLEHLTRKAIENGVTHAIGSPQLETNRAVHSFWRFFDGTRAHRRRRCYLKRF